MLTAKREAASLGSVLVPFLSALLVVPLLYPSTAAGSTWHSAMLSGLVDAAEVGLSHCLLVPLGSWLCFCCYCNVTFAGTAGGYRAMPTQLPSTAPDALFAVALSPPGASAADGVFVCWQRGACCCTVLAGAQCQSDGAPAC